MDHAADGQDTPVIENVPDCRGLGCPAYPFTRHSHGTSLRRCIYRGIVCTSYRAWNSSIFLLINQRDQVRGSTQSADCIRKMIYYSTPNRQQNLLHKVVEIRRLCRYQLFEREFQVDRFLLRQYIQHIKQGVFLLSSSDLFDPLLHPHKQCVSSLSSLRSLLL
ncbi:hypothetical protein DFJ58DRAFT_121449 [Suillus subalutaceus]|uniref:uncharacterized protein n=1 Tax=Suillus subalutaceus TaxID=48586 RepID=UPI001B870D5D|nr:uncharacterized protein DFJ58DRAFT_121449 [Suillus subalutaceus]KAG1838936.1 hypothetical protein DFJ58DRAFT_121449 [Suillus subalutaceus]